MGVVFGKQQRFYASDHCVHLFVCLYITVRTAKSVLQICLLQIAKKLNHPYSKFREEFIKLDHILLLYIERG